MPIAKGRPRVTTIGGKARAYTPARTVAYEGLIALAGQEAMAGRAPIEGPVCLIVEAIFPIPASWSKRRRGEAASGRVWHTGRPDGDNILKACGDGLNGVCWRDDSQIAAHRFSKFYGEMPGLHVVVETLA